MHFLESNDKEVAFKNLISNFIIPFDIKNDIIYCQKSFRIYLKIHQMAIIRYGDDIPTIPKLKKLMSDLEREIYQINAEQKYLIIRLRRSLEDFFTTFNVYNIPIERDYSTTYINEIFTNSIDNLIHECTLLPINVKKRRSLENWMFKFGLNSSDDNKQSSIILSNVQSLSTQPTASLVLQTQDTQQTIKTIESQTNDSESIKWLNGQENKQVSLLKPKSERSVVNENDNERNNNLDRINNIKIEPLSDEVSNVATKIEETEPIQPIVPKVAMSINTGRMNLLQALNKAKSQNQQIMSSSVPPQTITPTITNPKTNLLKFKKIPLIVTGSKKLRECYQICKPSTSKVKSKSNGNSAPQSSTSSDDSSDCLKNLPKLEDELPEPTQYNQEMFLRLFGLNTIAQSIYLQQRRSKRRRRNVQSNERKDFHYGHLDISQNISADKEKKKKIFLASPTASRNMKRKQIDKSYKYKARSSSSPEEKVLCNQCSKNGDIGLSQCQTCRGYFHARCHQGAFLKKPLHIREKICPSCQKKQKSRSNSSDEQSKINRNILPNSQISLLKELRGKLNTECSRKKSLIKESEIFKTKMNELFTIVDTIKKEDSVDDDNSKTIIKQLKCEESLIDTLKCNESINDDDVDKSSSSSTFNKLYSEEQNKFDKIMMLIHDDANKTKKNSDNDDNDNDNDKVENIYEICNNKDDNDDSTDDLYMIIDPSDDDEDDTQSVYQIQEDSSDSMDVQMLEQ